VDPRAGLDDVDYWDSNSDTSVVQPVASRYTDYVITAPSPLYQLKKSIDLTAVGIRCADHVTPSTRKCRHYFADSGGSSVGIVRLRTKATEFY
jgi:hypothetical protein